MKRKKIVKTVLIIGAVGLLGPAIYVGGAELLDRTIMFKHEYATNYFDAIGCALAHTFDGATNQIRRSIGRSKK